MAKARDLEAVYQTQICDDCLNCAYDEGMLDSDSQRLACLQMGEILPDHLCINVEERDMVVNGEIPLCICGCGKGAYQDLVG